MCNPPGGDWSGLSYLDFKNKTQYRWTSLPRVSKSNGKRPDHVIEIRIDETNILLLSLESKDNASSFDKEIGERLNKYTNDLVKTAPNVRKSNGASWELTKTDWKLKEQIIYNSGGAFCYKNEKELEKVIKLGKLDIIFALEFSNSNGRVILHIKSASNSNPLIDLLKGMTKTISKRLEIQVH